MATRVTFPYLGISISLSKLIETYFQLHCLNSLNIKESQETGRQQMRLSLNLPRGSGLILNPLVLSQSEVGVTVCSVKAIFQQTS